MKRICTACLLLALPFQAFAQESADSQPYTSPKPARMGSPAGSTTRDRSVLLMFTAVAVIAIGVTLAVVLIPSNNH